MGRLDQGTTHAVGQEPGEVIDGRRRVQNPVGEDEVVGLAQGDAQPTGTLTFSPLACFGESWRSTCQTSSACRNRFRCVLTKYTPLPSL